MRHHNKIKKFGRETNVRRALMRSLARNLILKGKIKTTQAKAKALRPFVEKLVTKARGGDLAARRLVASRLAGDKETKILFATIGPRYVNRPGGYTRITKLPPRAGDASPMSLIEFV